MYLHSLLNSAFTSFSFRRCFHRHPYWSTVVTRFDADVLQLLPMSGRDSWAWLAWFDLAPEINLRLLPSSLCPDRLNQLLTRWSGHCLWLFANTVCVHVRTLCFQLCKYFQILLEPLLIFLLVSAESIVLSLLPQYCRNVKVKTFNQVFCPAHHRESDLLLFLGEQNLVKSLVDRDFGLGWLDIVFYLQFSSFDVPLQFLADFRIVDKSLHFPWDLVIVWLGLNSLHNLNEPLENKLFIF